MKDELPKLGEVVIACGDSQMMFAFIASSNKKFTQVNTWETKYHDDITHWMKRPDFPSTRKFCY